MDDHTKAQIVEMLRELVIDMAPDADFRPMYGGTIIELVKDDPKSRIGGFYAYADYVSFEFAKGHSFLDPRSVLEGSGKFRRHVKLYDHNDIETKGCGSFLQQALAGQ